MRAIHVEKDRYNDSVLLMSISREVKALPDVTDAIVCMATPANLEHLARVGFTSPQLSETSPNDLLIAVDAANKEALEAARAHTQKMLVERRRPSGLDTQARPRTLSEAVTVLPEANFLLVSVPGAYAAREAREGLRRGLHVMLFSDNVSVEDEVKLKREASRRGLLMIGPDCGTAIINGKPLGFANAVRRGTIGIVGASGTGIQEISCLVHRAGGGISQAIGTGGRDLSEEVGGLMTQFGVAALGEDPQTEAIVVVSKAPADGVAKRILATLEKTGKPGVVHFVGHPGARKHRNVQFAGSLAEAATLACRAVGIEDEAIRYASDEELVALARKERKDKTPEQILLRGLFCGGTLCQEAWAILNRGGLEVFTNVALGAEYKIESGEGSEGSRHLLWDLGDDAFTVGRPHPMIEPALRDEHVIAAAQDPSVSVVLFDLVLGHGAHPDPATSLAKAVTEARAIAARHGGHLSIVASVTGTDRDPQGYDQQVDLLQQAGIWVMRSNAEAARLALHVVRVAMGEA